MQMSIKALDELLVAISNELERIAPKHIKQRDFRTLETVHGIEATLDVSDILNDIFNDRFKVTVTVPSANQPQGTDPVDAKTLRVKILLDEAYHKDILTNHDKRDKFMGLIYKAHFTNTAWKYHKHTAGNIYIHQDFKELDYATIAQAIASIPPICQHDIQNALNEI